MISKMLMERKEWSGLRYNLKVFSSDKESLSFTQLKDFFESDFCFIKKPLTRRGKKEISYF